MNIQLNGPLKRKILFQIKMLRRFFSPKEIIKIFQKIRGVSHSGIDAIYIINLDRQPDRWKQFLREAKRQRVEGKGTLLDFCHRVSAIDGRELNLGAIPLEKIQKTFNLKDQYYVDPDPQLLSALKHQDILIEMSREEIAVALSHVTTWQRIINENREYALILEDDIFFESIFAKNLNLLWKELPSVSTSQPKFDLLYLSYREVERGAEKLAFSKHLVRPIRGLWWLSGYVLSNAGAKKLLDLLPVRGPVDLWLNLQFTKLNIYASIKSILYQRVDLKSDNIYSILPILSQIGIQSDKTHLDLQQQKRISPVFVIGLNVRDSSIIDTALSLLGYRCCFDKWETFSDGFQSLINTREPLLFDAYINVKAIAQNFKILDLMYSNAVFILLVNSPSKLISREQQAVSPNTIIQANDEPLDYREFAEHFKYKAGKLLVMHIEELTDWKILSNFLGCEVPTCDFPQTTTIPKIPGYKIAPFLERNIEVNEIKHLEHDVNPWIIPIARLIDFGISLSSQSISKQVGHFIPIIRDEFETFDDSRWVVLESSFPSNLAEFVKMNFALSETGGFILSLTKRKSQSRNYSSASITSQQSYLFGRFDVTIKPIKMDGLITAFFLHRNDPWQELDIEFLGKDTSKVLINVYFNPGVNGSGWNFGNRGTPVLIDLGFDAADDYHQYSIEWEPHEIRWLVDDKLVYFRATWEPTPIPQLPMKLYVNLWPTQAEELAGTFIDNSLPVSIHVKSISVNSWSLILNET